MLSLAIYYSRHANSHFEDDEAQRDMELAQLAAVTELSTSVTVVFCSHSFLYVVKSFVLRMLSVVHCPLTNSGVFV